MRCETCGADNSDRAAFCQLCFTPVPRSGGGSRASRAVSVSPWIRTDPAEHAWWVKRRAEFAESMARGLPTKGGVYALAAVDGQRRYARAIWWSASVFTLFAWIATLRAASFPWESAAAVGGASATSAVVQSLLIGLVGIAAACVCAAWVSGPDAWRATLVNAFFWTWPALLLAVVGARGGEFGLPVVSVLAIGIVLITATVPLARGGLRGHLPKP